MCSAGPASATLCRTDMGNHELSGIARCSILPLDDGRWRPGPSVHTASHRVRLHNALAKAKCWLSGSWRNIHDVPGGAPDALIFRFLASERESLHFNEYMFWHLAAGNGQSSFAE